MRFIGQSEEHKDQANDKMSPLEINNIGRYSETF